MLENQITSMNQSVGGLVLSRTGQYEYHIHGAGAVIYDSLNRDYCIQMLATGIDIASDHTLGTALWWLRRVGACGSLPYMR